MKTAISIICLFILSVCCPLTSHSQTFQISNLSIQEGLPSNEVYQVFQDRLGFVWFATDNGVVRFDGHEMVSYHVQQGLVDPVVFGFHEDGLGRIWFRSYSGKLAYYDNGQIKQYPYNELISDLVKYGLVHSIYFDAEEHALWITVGKMTVMIDKNGSTKKWSFTQNTLFHQEIKGHSLYGNGTHPTGITQIQFDEKKFPISLSNGNNNPVVQSVRWRNRRLLSISNDIFSFDGKQVVKIFTGRSNIINLSVDHNDHLWVGYLYKGCDQFRDYDFLPLSTPDVLTDLSISSIVNDSEGGYWFSTLEKGVYYSPRSFAENFQFPHLNKVRSVFYQDNCIIAGDIKGNLVALDGITKKPHWTKKFTSSIISLFKDSKQNLSVSLNDGQLLFDKNQNQLKIDTSKAATSAKVDCAESNDKSIWCVAGRHVIKMDGTNGSVLHRTNEALRAICIGKSGIYLAGRTGLKVYSTDFKLISYPKSLASLKITDIQNINDTTLILLTTGSGFVLLTEKSLNTKRYDSENKLIANTIHSAVIHKSVLWLGTENGLIRTELENLLKDKPTFRYLTKMTGLASNKVNFLAVANNSIWAFTENGVSIIPDSIQTFSNTNPTFYLKKILINQIPFDLTPGQNLAYHQNNISISFGFISYSNNKNIKVRFRLSPTDPWVYAERRYLEFYSLSPNSYKLTLQYSVDNNEWMTAIDQLSFTINPPWWRAWYYQLTIFMILLAIVSLYFRGRVSVWRQKQKYYALIKDQQQKLLQSEIQTIERERGRIAKDLHDTVGTNLAAVKMIVSQLLRKHHEPLAENIESQLQDIIKETKELIYNLVPPGLERFGLFVLVRNHISKLNHSTQTQIEITTSGNDVYRTDRNIIIFRIIQELISNSLKHANATTISIGINTFENHVNIMYEDNGHGFKNEGNQSGFGILNIQSRVESLTGEIRFESGHSGTFYTLNIPYPQNEDSNP